MTKEAGPLYAGISGVTLPVDHFDLGHGVTLSRTYAHLFATNMMAFARPERPGLHHPSPWKAAKGGYAFDIEIELTVPAEMPAGVRLSSRETIWWIAALLRMASLPFLLVPVLSNKSFNEIPKSEAEPVLEPFETTPRIFGPADANVPSLDEGSLQWIKEIWPSAAVLLRSNKYFRSVIEAFDFATVRGKTSASLLAVWGAMERLFSSTRGESRFRTACFLAAYLEPPGEGRHKVYKRLLTLYDIRSDAAHTTKEIEQRPLVESYVILRNALVKMVQIGKVPTQADLEAYLFSTATPPQSRDA